MTLSYPPIPIWPRIELWRQNRDPQLLHTIRKNKNKFQMSETRDTRLVDVFHNPSEEEFRNFIYFKRRPALLKGVNIGSCIQKWNSKYLAEMLGNERVKIHVSESEKMDFLKKNFLYKSLPFDVFLNRASNSLNEEHFISEKEFYYLRSLGDNARKDAADIRKQFPQVSEDLIFPKYFEEANFFSSVFRVGSACVTLWTHYDIMDNILIQVVGRKKAILFPPDDVPYLYMNGDKSEVIDVEHPDLNIYPEFSKATRYQCIMEPGDILFIPALWFHNVTSLDFGVAVNVFWRHLNEDLYNKKDPYGNKDVAPAAQSTRLLDTALKNLELLPIEYQRFYALRMIEQIKKRYL